MEYTTTSGQRILYADQCGCCLMTTSGQHERLCPNRKHTYMRVPSVVTVNVNGLLLFENKEYLDGIEGE
jgi:hypothetical protein